MAQLDGSMQKHSDNLKNPTTPTVEELLRGGEASKWSPNSSPTCHDMEEDHGYHQKKSVLAKVKEKAKKWKHSLSIKKRHSEDNTTPSWGVSLEEEDDEDPEYFGAPMYESELAPEACKEAARQHPRADPVISEKHVLPSSVEHGSEEEENGKTITKKMREKLEPAYTTVADASHEIASTIQGLRVSTQTGPETEDRHGTLETEKHSSLPMDNKQAAVEIDKFSTLPTDKLANVETNQQATLETNKHHTPETPKQVSPGKQVWDKGVSVKEYVMNKFEPGEDERALSQVIVDAISPRRKPGDVSVVEKVKEAVTSLLWSQDSSKSTVAPTTTATAIDTTTTSSSPRVPISTNAHEVVGEENHGRILQAN